MWPEDEILQPEMNPWKFFVARARPEPKPQARNPTRTMKKVTRPSPTRLFMKEISTFYLCRKREFSENISRFS